MHDDRPSKRRIDAAEDQQPRPRVDPPSTASVHFAPPVKEWIEYLAERLAREVIRESERRAA